MIKWLPIIGFEGRYEVSNTGLVKSVIKKLEMSIQRNNAGYSHVNLWKDGKYTKSYIHRLVAVAFIPNPINKPEVNHIDFNPANNHFLNLEWTTESENRLHSSNNNRVRGAAKEKVPIRRISKNGLHLDSFSSISEAQRLLKISQQNISKVLSGERKYAGGYYWEVNQ